jgi:hypothetical protein
VISSPDGRVAVKVFPTMSRNVRITVRMVSNAPATPGQLVDGLTFSISGEFCEGGALTTLPAEVNLGVHYSDQDAGALNEASFTIARLSGTQWTPEAKQASDPTANYVSATITGLGTYAVYQR